MEELKKDIKEIKSDISEIKIAVAGNSVSLDHHIKRTDLSERRIESIEKWQLGLITAALIAVVAAVLKH